MKINPFNPRLIYLFSIFTIVFTGLILSLNYHLLGRYDLAKKQRQKILPSFLYILAAGIVIQLLLYDKVMGSKNYVSLFIFICNLVVSHFWITKQFEIYNRNEK